MTWGLALRPSPNLGYLLAARGVRSLAQAMVTVSVPLYLAAAGSDPVRSTTDSDPLTRPPSGRGNASTAISR